MLGSLFTWKTLLLVGFATICVFMYRFFCRFICPLGALYGFFNRFSFLGITVNQDKCTNCGLCIKVCKMDVRKVGDHECINCGECISVCKTEAIVWRGKKPTLAASQIETKAKEVEITIGQNNYKYKRVLKDLEITVCGDDVDLKYTFTDVPFERIRRITGYLVGTLDRFNDAKRAEESERVKHTLA